MAHRQEHNTEHEEHLRAISDGWHYLHSIHRQIKRINGLRSLLRSDREMSREYCVHAIGTNARTLAVLGRQYQPSETLRRRAKLEADYLRDSLLLPSNREWSPRLSLLELGVIRRAHANLEAVGRS